MKLFLCLALVLTLIKARGKYRYSGRGGNGNGYIAPRDILNSATIKNFIGYTRDKWMNLKPLLHPTQPDVGYAWVIRKVHSDFDSSQSAQKTMNPKWSDKWPNIDKSDFNETSDTIPCLIGPAGPNNDDLTFYVIDSHHTLSALDYSGYDKTYVYINIIFDYRMYDYQSFVDEMMQQKNTYLFAQKGTKKELPELIDFSDLPDIFDLNRDKKSLGDSTWRSLAGYSRKVKVAPHPYPTCDEPNDSKFCMRPFERVCDQFGFGIPFYEFIWGYFYVDAAYFDMKYWEDQEAFNQFIDTYNYVLFKYYDCNGNWIDPEIPKYGELVEDWQFLSSLLVPLARGEITANYKPHQYFDILKLPGYAQGPQKLPDDENCAFNTV